MPFAVTVLWVVEAALLTVAQVYLVRRCLGPGSNAPTRSEIDLEGEAVAGFHGNSVQEESTVPEVRRKLRPGATAPSRSAGQVCGPKSIALLAILNAALVIFFFDICMTTHPFGLSTMITRLLRSSGCKVSDGVCYAYITAGQDLRTSAIYNFAATVHASSLEGALNYSTVQVSRLSGNNTGFPYPVATFCFVVPTGEMHHRVQCHADLMNLEPDTLFRVELQSPIVGAPEDSSLGRVHFSTAPTTGRLRYGAGGDYEVDKGPALLSRAAHYYDEPLHAFLLNGDLSYANGLRACAYRWDDAIRGYVSGLSTKVELPDGTTGMHVPQLITAIGNHETGKSFDCDPFRLLPAYIALFPHVTGKTDTSYVSAVTTWPTYHSHTLSDFARLLVLDPGVMEGNWPTPGGRQEQWMEEQLAAAHDAGQTQLATAAHYAMFPAKFDYAMTENRVAMRKAWLPLYDRYHVRFMHDAHYHVFKVSKAMVNETVVGNSNSSDGTVYLGDGALGVHSRDLHPAEEAQHYMEASSSQSHVYVLQLDSVQSNVTALTADKDAEPLIRISRTHPRPQHE
jgi:hypothetical protein